MKYIRKKERIEEINIAPLIDMVFILLIFFAVSTTFIKDMKIDIERPKAGSSISASTKAVRVYIDRGGNTYVDEQPVKLWMLQSRIRDLLSVTIQKTVLVVADRLISAERLVEVVDQCRLGGAAEVGVATEMSVH
ncbi:MAG: biopolymer transporter ExbD [Candidatus Schekmanbacteria bacterium RBG_13_48_7]|uniref:Biopolymer transporter ExbD n=1 Tax=Candidatus Schekmanbacteria bacterium RBG_13_48_7 TaxID=1817878 RepID=A0A1F7S2Z0_9BACT|nr:MAG: biopolymer transporter ExbD [Candidatus Schekmanbacteria bacterium RBG_13_48_7]